MCDAGARRRDLQQRAAAQQIALDHRGMRIDPGGVRQGGDAGNVERAVDPHATRPHFADAAATQRQTRQARIAQVDRGGDVALFEGERGKSRPARSGTIGEVEQRIDARAADAHARQADRPRLARRGQAQQQMTQEGGAENRHGRTGKYRDLPARGARDHFGLGVEQRRRVEGQDTQFIGHSIVKVTICLGSA